MMTRRQFLRASALVSAGVIAADQLEILDRLAPRSLFASAQVPKVVYGITGLAPFDYVAVIRNGRTVGFGVLGSDTSRVYSLTSSGESFVWTGETVQTISARAS